MQWAGLVIGGVMVVIGVALSFNLNGAADVVIAQQRHRPYARFFPWATSEGWLRIWAGVVALVGVAVVVAVLWAQISGK